MPEQPKHRHHKQPQYYLEGFGAAKSHIYQKTSDIYVYKKSEPFRDGVNPSLESIKDAGYEKDFYAYTKADGTPDFNKYENILMRDFENPAIPVFEKIRRKEKIDDKDKMIFSRYIASMVSRSDWGRNLANIALPVAEEMILNENPDLPEKVMKLFRQIMEDEKNRGEIFVEPTVNTPDVVAPLINEMNWVFYESFEDLHYFTTDNPVWRFKPLEKEGSILFPISTNLVLKASRIEGDDRIYKKSTKDFVHYVRDKIASIIINEAYCMNKSELFVKFINSERYRK